MDALFNSQNEPQILGQGVYGTVYKIKNWASFFQKNNIKIKCKIPEEEYIAIKVQTTLDLGMNEALIHEDITKKQGLQSVELLNGT